jgi:hypothetical protein
LSLKVLFGLNTNGNIDYRYTLLYNSECDSSNPRSVSEIVKQVEREEREEAKANSKVFKVTIHSKLNSINQEILNFYFRRFKSIGRLSLR